MSERHDIWHVADGLQMDLRAAQAKMVELRARLAQLDLPAPAAATCPDCGIQRPGPRSLAEHLHAVHDGPEPEHWQAGRAQADDDEEPDVGGSRLSVL